MCPSARTSQFPRETANNFPRVTRKKKGDPGRGGTHRSSPPPRGSEKEREPQARHRSPGRSQISVLAEIFGRSHHVSLVRTTAASSRDRHARRYGRRCGASTAGPGRAEAGRKRDGNETETCRRRLTCVTTSSGILASVAVSAASWRRRRSSRPSS